jgi:amidase
MAKMAEKVTRAQAERADLIASNIYGQMSEVFDRYNLFICPTTATARIPADFDPGVDEFEINGEKIEPNLGWGLTYPFNMISRCPVLDIPAGMAPNGVPIGMQLVAPTYEDAVVFQAGAAYEAAAGPFCSVSHHPFQ